MLYTRFHTAEAQAVGPAVDLSCIIDVLGTSEFGPQLEKLMFDRFGVSEFFIFQTSLVKGQPVALYVAGQDATAAGRARAYCSEFHKVDPLHELITQESADGLHYLHSYVETIRNPRYRAICFTGPQLVEKLSISRKAGNEMLVLNVYARADQSGFSPTQIDRICQFAPTVLPLLALHFRLLGEGDAQPSMSVAQMEDCVAWTFPSLTPREVAVCARSILGVTAEGIAIDLGIGQTSVLTYRRRAYARLNINSINQMSSILIQSSAVRKLTMAA